MLMGSRRIILGVHSCVLTVVCLGRVYFLLLFEFVNRDRPDLGEPLYECRPRPHVRFLLRGGQAQV